MAGGETAATQTKYGPYPAYKPSNTEWLGDIPEGWLTIQIGRLFRRIKRTGFIDKELLSVYRDHGVVPKSSRDDNNNKASEDLNPYQLVKKNDLVLNKMKTWQGSIAVSDFEGIVSPAYFVYQPEEKLFEVANPKYVHFLVRNPMYIAQYLRRSKGIRVSQWDLDPGEFQRIELLLPPIPEQTKIAAFLDHETAKIDALIAKQQRLIALLEEKRQAVISHAVTKGLNPSAPLSPSGIDWLGDVPEHWEVKLLKHLGEVTDCKHITAEFTDDGFPLASIAEVKGWSVNLDTAKFTTKKYYDSLIEGGRRPEINDIIYSRNATVGAAAIVAEGMPEFAMGQDVCLIRLSTIVLPALVLHILKSKVVEQQLELAMIGSTFKRINVEDIRNLRMAVPPKAEQKSILLKLEKISSKYADLIEKASLAVSLLKERRTALISAAVTGKIDLRDWQPPASASTSTAEISKDEFA